MSYNAKDYPSIWVFDLFANLKRLVNIDSANEKNKAKKHLYTDIITMLNNVEKHIQLSLNDDKIARINSMPSDNDNDMFEIESFILGNTSISYLSVSKTIIKINNRYVRDSDLRDYNISNPMLNILTYPKLLAHIVYNKLESFYVIPNYLDINLEDKWLDLDNYNIDNYNLVNKLHQLEKIKVSNKFEKAIKGELNLPNLKELKIIGNQTLPNLNNLPLLTSLSISYLKILNTSMNLLQSNLKEIRFNNCGLLRFDIQLPQTLEILDICSNRLTILKLSSINLKEVYASNNDIVRIEFVKLSKLNILDLGCNNLTSITLGTEIDQIAVKSMKFIGLNNNWIHNVNFLNGLESDKPESQYINLSYNQIYSINNTFDHMCYLTKLNLSYNNLREITIPTLLNSSRLKHLNIMKNNIEDIPWYIFYNLKNLTNNNFVY